MSTTRYGRAQYLISKEDADTRALDMDDHDIFQIVTPETKKVFGPDSDHEKEPFYVKAGSLATPVDGIITEVSVHAPKNVMPYWANTTFAFYMDIVPMGKFSVNRPDDMSENALGWIDCHWYLKRPYFLPKEEVDKSFHFDVHHHAFDPDHSGRSRTTAYGNVYLVLHMLYGRSE